MKEKAEKEAAKAAKEAAKAEKEAAKAEKEAKKQEAEKKTEKKEEEPKEPCNTCRKTVSIPKHKCKKEDVRALPKPPTLDQQYPEPPKLERQPTYVDGDSEDDEPMTYQQILRIRQAERKRIAALRQVQPLQAWYNRK